MTKAQQICPFLWYDDQAEEAAAFYTSIFPNSEIHSKGSLVVDFSLNGLRFQALNGGPQFTFNESCSFVVYCDTQEDIDHYWEALMADGGEPSRCGWLKDKFGLSWQVVPNMLNEFQQKGEPEKAKKMMEALMEMDKLIIEDLESAYNS